MIFKLAEAAEKNWRRLDGHNQLPKVVLGVKFIGDRFATSSLMGSQTRRSENALWTKTMGSSEPWSTDPIGVDLIRQRGRRCAG
jgi:hypothetical protein